VFRRRRLAVCLAAGLTLVVSGLAAIPSAQADTCVVTVTVSSGQKLTFDVTVPSGTPLSAISLPVTQPVSAISESCSSGTATTPTVTTKTATGTTTTSTSTATATATSPSPVTVTVQTKSSRPKASTSPAKAKGKAHNGKGSKSSSSGKTSSNKPTKFAGAGGVPTANNPTYSFALPGAAPIGVPNFFIDSFQIPPFLLPIYQAAGIEYDVPWQVLAAINNIETDYGRDLAVSSAGAVGWMQFLPSTWKKYGVDATGSGVADPDNPVDAIFAAARYLQAAGASTNLAKAIFAYNHASWYVSSVLLRAQLIGGMPQQVIGALTGLVEGHFPVAAPAKYADDDVERLADKRMTGRNAAEVIDSDPTSSGTAIYAAKGSPVIAVNDGKIVKLGYSKKLGRYVELQDATGNTYTYAQLGSVSSTYPVPKPVRITAADIAKELSVAPGSGKIGKQPTGSSVQQTPAVTPGESASAGYQPTATTAAPTTATTSAVKHAASTASSPLSLPAAPATKKAQGAPLVKERLFADPARPASYAAGGEQQLQSTTAQISSFQNYFSDVLHLDRNQYTLAPLRIGSIVSAGTILGRIGGPSATQASHLYFMVQPAGRNAPYIDPKVILDGWKLLEATAVYRAAGIDPFFGPGAKQASTGEVLLMSKEQLIERVLADPHVSIYACGRRDIEGGLIDRRILATIEFLSSSGLDPTISGLECGATVNGADGVDLAGKTGASMDISAINGIPVLGHQGSGSITDITIRRLLTLQGAMAPSEIVSLMAYKGQTNTISLPDHANRIQLAFTPLYGENKKLSGEIKSILKPNQWIKLINRISQIPEPVVPIAPSKYAIRVGG
jgi:murein DD-endopeptidase MepM/ murein hydrolase activator NlpD